MGHFDMLHLSLGIPTTPFLELLIFIKLNFLDSFRKLPYPYLDHNKSPAVVYTPHTSDFPKSK